MMGDLQETQKKVNDEYNKKRKEIEDEIEKRWGDYLSELLDENCGNCY